MAESTIRTRRWTRREYSRLIDVGVLHEDDPIELLEGRLVVGRAWRCPRLSADHPATAALVVEVSDAGLELDRRLKARIYARVVNLVDRVVEVHRDPIAARRRRSRYRDVTPIAPAERIVPLAAPFSSILIADLLP